MERHKTKIICTLGPASSSREQIQALIEAGMNFARINFSHGTYQEHQAKFELLKELNADLREPVGLMVDLCGPKLRLGELADGPVELVTGAEVLLTGDASRPGDATRLPVMEPQLIEDLSPGDHILLHDGVIVLQAKARTPDGVICVVENGGEIDSHQGINVPDVQLSIPSVTKKDRQDLEFALAFKPDWISLSFVRSAQDVEILRYLITAADCNLPIVAKIEKREAVSNIDEIIEAADAIMVARGDLGVEIPIEQVPMVQKQIISKCVDACKPVITATQMLESMVENLSPTRAEVTDVANAIFDGTDAVLMAEETAIGKHPVFAVKTMLKLARTAEANLKFREFFERASRQPNMNTAEAVAQAACQLAYELDARAIIAPTTTGTTPARIARYRPKSPIVAVTPHPQVQRKLQLWFGVVPLLAKPAYTVDELLAGALQVTREVGLIKEGDLVIIVGGVPVGVEGATNFVKAHVVGQWLIGHSEGA